MKVARMSIIREALAYLVNVGRAECRIRTMELPAGKLLVSAGEDYRETFDRDGPRIYDWLNSLVDLDAWIENEAGGVADVFVAHQMVCAMCDRGRLHLKKTAIVALKKSAALIAILGLIEGEKKQAAFVRALRGPLDGCLDPKWLPVFRRINFSRLDQSNRAIASGGEKLGRSVEMAAQSSDGELPDYLTFSVKMVSVPECPTVSIRLALEIDHELQTFALLPAGDALENAWSETLEALAEILKAKIPSACVYVGSAGE